jgi:S1-C subfamily serine protease
MHAACTLRNDRGSWQVPVTPGTVTVTTSSAPLEVSCRGDEAAGGTVAAPSSLSATTSKGAVAGGIAGGATAGAVFGATALTVIPVLGVIIVASSIAAGAAAGQAVESHRRTLTYPASISIPMMCSETGATAAAQSPARSPLGLGIRGLSMAQAREAGLGERGGVLTLSLSAGGRAAAAGLRSGDIILAVGRHDVQDATDMEEWLRTFAPGAEIPLRVWRDGRVLHLLVASASVAP